MKLNLKTGGRLALAFFAVIAVALVTIGTVVPQIQNASRRVSLAADVRGPAAMTSLKLSVATVSSANALRGYIITHDPSLRDQWSTQWTRVDELTAQMNRLAPNFTNPQNKADWASLSQTLPKLKAAQAAAFQVADTGDAAAAAQALKEQVLPVFKQTQALLVGEKGNGGLASRQSQLLTSDLEAARAQMKRSELQIMISLAALIALAALVGWLTTRAIAAPLTQLNGLLLQMAGGRFDLKVTGTERADEIGDIARSAEVFRENGLERAKLEAQAAAFQQHLDQKLKETETAFEAAGHEQKRVVDAMARALSALAEGDLTTRLSAEVAADYAALKQDFNTAVSSLESAIATIAQAASGIGNGSDEIASASDDLSRRTEQQAASLEETAAALDEITSTVRRTAAGSTEAASVVATARGDAEQSSAIMREAVEAMSAIEESSTQISRIIGVIDEIAFQTNLLALNAGVEAARAGDAGRGFAVVASEVRSLAQRSADSAKEIKALINTSAGQVGQGVDLVGRTGEALQRIVAQFASIDAVVREISASAQEQATGLHQVNTAVNQMDQVVQQNAAMVEQASAATYSLKGEADQLTELVGRFKVTRAASGQRDLTPPANRAPPRFAQR
ncbi:methyl-accepting chemotaxis protein [Caulobacter ginsengisoli]|uniref:Methyl-accepting chemotaxis protein n=1 Tax=Caulobacter ginsengisoli TaxID=400775 RepID=A0ABU0INX5_9CAUL|nr:methyl-accepting chemotaxis protein [Caulobacter ginsengisoli]MDQ0463701.1 methyl-accepting chemotaxis protein [Caulobacter ginsengisoli]